MSITNAVLENLPQNRVSKKYIFLGPFLCTFVQPKTSYKLSVNIDLVYSTWIYIHYTMYVHIVRKCNIITHSFVFLDNLYFASFTKHEIVYCLK